MPSFSIETTGQAVPMEPSTLIHTLQAASSSDQQQIKAASQQLENWKGKLGYHVLLLNIIADVSIPLEARYMASIQMKNDAARLWRRGPAGSIGEDEKQEIRRRIIDIGLEEEDRRLLIQIALIVGTIVRHDFPRAWQNVFDVLQGKLRSNPSSAVVLRSLVLLLNVTKNAMVSRLKATRQALHEAIVKGAFPTLFELYQDRYENRWRPAVEQMNSDPNEVKQYAEESLLCIRILRRLAVSAFPQPDQSAEFLRLWAKSSEQFDDLAVYLINDTQAEFRLKRPIAEAHARQLAKMHLEIAQMQSADFSYALLPHAANLTIAYWSLLERANQVIRALKSQGVPEEGTSTLAFLSLKSMLILRAAVKTISRSSKRIVDDTNGRKRQDADARADFKSTVFTHDRVRAMADTLSLQYFRLDNVDLQEWREDPEDWERQQEGSGDAWEHLARPCAERLFLDLIFGFEDVIKRPLLDSFQHVMNIPAGDLRLDAILCAIGLAAASLHNELPMSQFVQSHVPKIQEWWQRQDNWECNVIKRRLAILVGQFSSIGLKQDVKSNVYALYEDLLNPQHDLAVRIAAARHLRDAVLEIEFNRHVFQPGLRMTPMLMNLASEVDGVDTKVEILETLQAIVQQVEYLIGEYSLIIFNGLGPIWDRAGEQYLIKQHVIYVMAALLQSTKEDGRKFHGTAVPLIASVVEPGSPLQPYLLEEILDLWKSLLTSAESASSEAIDLVSLVFPLTEYSGRTLERSLELLDSYILLAPSQMLSPSIAPRIFACAASLFGDLQLEVFQLLMIVLDDLLQQIPTVGGLDLLSTIADQMASSGLLAKTRTDLRKAWEADHQPLSPRARGRSILELRLARSYLAIYARICLYSPQIFATTMQSVAQTAGEDFDSMMTWILTVWTEHLDGFASFAERKLHCLALTQLLETKQGWVLDRMGDLVALWTDLVGEVQADRTVDLIDWLHGLDEDPQTVSPEKVRRQELERRDAAKTADLEVVVKERIQRIQEEVGGSAAFRHGLQGVVSEDTLLEFSKLGLQ